MSSYIYPFLSQCVLAAYKDDGISSNLLAQKDEENEDVQPDSIQDLEDQAPFERLATFKRISLPYPSEKIPLIFFSPFHFKIQSENDYFLMLPSRKDGS